MRPLVAIAFALLIVVIGIFVVITIRKQDYRQRESSNPMPPPGQMPTDEDVARLAQAGQKIAAIKMYREIHGGTGLAEAKSAVEDMEARGNRRVDDQDSPPVQRPADEEVLRLVRAGQKIAAIKRYREIHGVGLADAKAAVEALESRSDRSHGDQP